MKQIHTYQQGDPEWLIIQKQYHELLPEELDGLKEWIGSAEEYDRMRSILLELHDDQEEWLEPDASIKKNLMRKFVAEEKGGRLVWLNGVFFSRGQSWYKQPILQYGLAAACLIGLAVFFFQPTGDIQDIEGIAKEDKQGPIESANQDIAATEGKAADTLKQFAESKPEMPLPPAPVVVFSETSGITESEAPMDDAMQMPRIEAVESPLKEEAMAVEGKNTQDDEEESALTQAQNYKDAASAPSAISAPQMKNSEAKSASTLVNTNLSVNCAEVSHLFDGLYTAR